MTSKPTDSQELKLGRGWTALSKNPSPLSSTAHNANHASSRAVASADPPTLTTAPRIAYTKAQLLDLYEPGSTAAIPPDMAKYPGLTSSEPLVPVNIAPDDHIPHVSALVETSDPPPGRQRFQSTSSRPGVEAILGRDPASSVASQPAPVDSSPDHPSSSPPVKKTNHPASSTRDFWAGSAVLAPAERPAGSGASAAERQKLALKPRPNPSDRAASPNGHAADKSAAQPPYWSRTTTRGIADSKSNWRGGSTANPSVASGGAKYPGSTVDDSQNPGSSGGSLQNPTSRKAGADTAVTSGGLGRSAFQRDRDGAFFGRGKEALKPTNTRDLSALASRGSSRDQPSSGGSFFQDRESRDSRHTGADSQPKSHPDIMSDPRKIWFYRDPQGITQGPFPASQLMEWHKAGYYDEELPVSKSRDHGFKALAVAFGIRKDDSLSRTPPPGFMKDLATGKKENGGGHGLSGRSTREDRSRKASKTVEEMAEEVEMMRLQKRKHNQEKNAARSVDGINGKETSFFDESTTSTGAVKRKDFLSEARQEPNNDARAISPSLSGKADEVVSADLLPHQTSTDANLTRSDGDLKAKPPLKQSRFASFMEHDSEESGDEPVRKLTVGDIERDIEKKRTTPQPTFMPMQDDSARSTGSDAGQKHSILTENTEATQSSSSASNAWGAMMKSLQQQQQDQTRVTSKEVPAMPPTAAEQDLMAIDPAIAHASFARPSVNSSSSASSPRVPSSGTELPPWLQFSGPADLATTPVTADQARDTSRPMHMSSQIQSSLGMQAALQNPAQLQEHHVRVQTDMQARAEAAAQMERMRQMQAQVQQAQAQQAQARVAAQRASALAQAQAQAQVQAQVQAQAQLQAHAQASHSQTQASMQLPSHPQEQTWALKHQLNQYQHRFDLSYRAQVEATRTLQTARRHAAATPVGSVEQRNYLTLAAQAEAAAKEHAINMERIKAAAANVHGQLLQIMAHGPHQQRDYTNQGTQHSPQPGDGMSPVSAGHGDVPSPHQSNGNGALSVQSANSVRMGGSDLDIKSTENLPVSEEELVRRNQASVQRNLNDAYDAMAHAENNGWERVNRKTKPGIGSTPVEKSIPDPVHAVEEDHSNANRTSVSLENTVTSQSIMRATADSTNLKGEVEESSRNLSDDSERVGQLLSVHHAEQQLHVETTPTVAPWSKPMPGPSVSTGPSLREIQRQEELRNKAQEREARTAQLEREESRPVPTRWNPVQPWGGAGDQAKHRTLSLREQIRLEEEQKRKKSASVVTEPVHTGSAVTTKTGWASLVAKSKPVTTSRPSVSVVGKKMDDSTPFWDAVSSMPPSSLSASPQKPAYSHNGQGTAAQGRQALGSSRGGPLHGGNQQHAVKAQASNRAGVGEHREKKGSSDGVVVKGRISNEFANWCTENLQKITGNNNRDMTLVEYLVAIKSPSEIRETVVQNLGSSDKSRSFADEFIRRLEFERSSVVADAGNNGAMGRKKGRRQRGAKVDPSLVLGFTSTSSSSRIMQGTIETPEMK